MQGLFLFICYVVDFVGGIYGEKMQITIIAVGSKMPNWVNQGFFEYKNRISAPIQLNLIEINLQKRTDKHQQINAIKKETMMIYQHITPQSWVVTLDSKGKNYTSEQLAEKLTIWQEKRNIALIIGGPEGIDQSIKNRANESWSLGNLTMPHPLVRIVVAEALYRAQTILQNHPYHRG